MKQHSFYIKTFGCQMNERDSEIMAQTLSQHSAVETMEMESADIIILNTCSIRAKAEQKVMSLLGYLRKLKEKKPEMKICVAGCVAQQEGKQLIEKMPHVNLVLGTQNIYNIASYLKNLQDESLVAIDFTDKYNIPKLLPSFSEINNRNNDSTKLQYHFSKYVTIMQGCNNYCSYCVVPYTRGREISRLYNDIIDEVKAHIQAGVKEIVLLGQNVNSYGQTNPVRNGNNPVKFSDLLRDVSEISGLKRIRFTTSNPKDLTDDLMKCFGEINNLCPQFHLPVQSGSDRILKKMNRNYSIKDYLHQIETLKSYRPDICLTTDMIIGFPGETDDDFELTMKLLNDVKFHSSFSFKYSDRPGTRSTEFTDKIEEPVKSARLQRFQKRQDEISLERNQNFVGRNMELLVVKEDNGSVAGRTETNHIVHLQEKSPDLSVGDFCYAKITYAGPHSLKGILIQ